MQVEILQTRLKEKEGEVEHILVNLHKSQESCKQLQEENGMVLYLYILVGQPYHTCKPYEHVNP